MNTLRKFLLLLIFCVLYLTTFSQTWSPSTGVLSTNPSTTKVGIGTTTPESRLQVTGTEFLDAMITIERNNQGWGGVLRYIAKNSGGIPLGRSIGNILWYGSNSSSTITTNPTVKIGVTTTQNWSTTGNGTQLGFWTTPNGSTAYPTNPNMLIDHNGRVAIGKVNPAYTLDVNGAINATELRVNGVLFTGGGGSSQWTTSGSTIYYNGGNVGIGTTNTGSFKLAVEGKIGAREIQVTLANPWPDYVFEPNYRLLSLTDLRRFIETNKHLPEIPSAEEINESGHNLGEMNMLLLKKVEELTLYILDQESRINEQSKLLLEVKAQLDSAKYK